MWERAVSAANDQPMQPGYAAKNARMRIRFLIRGEGFIPRGLPRL
jgi:hypothetical protein